VSAALALVLAALAFAFALADSALLAESFEDVDEGSGAALERQHRMLSFGRLAAQLGTGVAVARALALPGRTTSEAAILGLLAGALLVALTEVAAREVGDLRGARVRAALRPLVRLAEVLLAPFVAVGMRLDESLLRALPPQEVSEVTREETAEQFREIVAAEADVTGPERALIASVFTLGDTPVSEVMVPRVDVIGVDIETPWSELVDRVRSSAHSRVPVYEDTIDEIVGVVYAKDLLPAVIAGEPPEPGWETLIRPATFIPATKRADDQLRDFRQSGSHLAVVVDEYGGTEGIVTIEDLLEEIVGEIRDERDEEEAAVTSEGDRRFWVSARVTLDELSEILGVPVEHDEVSTAGGLVYELLGRVPRAGESLTVAGFRVVVERVVRRKIQRLYFERLPEPESEDGEDADLPEARVDDARFPAANAVRAARAARAERGNAAEGAP
jgi:putative hemolysin